MAINKVVYGNQVLIDITDSTVNPNTLLAGYKAYGANGQPVNGALQLSYHITLKQAQYDALSESEKMADENWFYIDDAKSIGAQLDDSSISPAKVWSSQKTNSEIQDVQDQVDINTTDIGTLNSALVWKQAGSSATGTTPIDISGLTDYNELLVSVDIAGGGNVQTFLIPKTILKSSNQVLREGGYSGAQAFCMVLINITTSSISLYSAIINNQTLTATSVTSVYYR